MLVNMIFILNFYFIRTQEREVCVCIFFFVVVLQESEDTHIIKSIEEELI
jgi:hypothetical protein